VSRSKRLPAPQVFLREDLLIADRTMPQMSGPALARRARELRPDLGPIDALHHQ
jgi:hypothetical protein